MLHMNISILLIESRANLLQYVFLTSIETLYDRPVYQRRLQVWNGVVRHNSINVTYLIESSTCRAVLSQHLESPVLTYS